MVNYHIPYNLVGYSVMSSKCERVFYKALTNENVVFPQTFGRAYKASCGGNMETKSD